MEKENELNNINSNNKKEEQEKMPSPGNLQESFDLDEQNEIENQKNNTSTEDIITDKKKLNDLLTTELMNKMKLISPIPQSNAPKRKMSGVAMMEKDDGNEDDEYLDEKDEDNFSSSDNNENENINNNNDENKDEDSSQLSGNTPEKPKSKQREYEN